MLVISAASTCPLLALTLPIRLGEDTTLEEKHQQSKLQYC